MSSLPARLRPPRRHLAVMAVASVAVVVLVGLLWWRSSPTELEAAARIAPEGTLRMTYVDWAGLRTELDVDLDTDSSAEELDEFLARGFDRDLTMPSTLGGSAQLLHERFGFSPATLAWESLAQASDGAVLLLGLAEGTDLAGIRDRLARVGYSAPKSDEGIWRGGPEVVARAGGELNEIFGHVAVIDDGIVLASDDAAYLDVALEAAAGEDHLDPEAVVAAAEDPLAAIYFVDDHACTALAMSQASNDEQTIATDLVKDAGKVNPYRGLVVSAQRDASLRALFGFGSDDQARTNATTRAVLAEGPAPGQGGSFTDRFTLEAATATGSLLELEMRPTESGTYAFSDISSGPVLFATC